MILACSTNLPQPPENPQHWLMNWSKQQLQNVTFVLDYADDALESQDSQEKPFVTMMHDIRTLSKQKITFVITSRKTFQADGSHLKIENIRLSSLLPDDATRLLLSKVHNEKTRQKLTQKEKIVELCGCVPLALCIVGSLLLDYEEDRLISSLEKEPLDILQDDEISFENTIRTSFDLLKPREQEALVILSVFPRSFDSDAADSVIAARTDSGVQPVIILRSLKSRSLLEQTNSGKYQIHQLIQAFAKKIGQDKCRHVFDELEQVGCAHFLYRLCSLSDVYWSKDKCKEAIEAFNGDRHNFEYFLQVYVQVMEDQFSSHKLLESSTARFLDRFPQKCMYLEMCLLPSFYTMILQELLTHFYTGNYPVQTVELLCLLAHEKRKVGNLEEYIELMNKAKYVYHWNYTEFRLKGLSQVLFFNSYARFLFEKRFPNGMSRKVYGIALQLCYKKLGEHPETGVTLLFIGKRRKCIPNLQEATVLFTACLGEHFMTAQGHKAIADVYFAHRDTDAELDMALFHYQQALDMMEKCGMGGHKESILALKNYATCLRRKGNYEEAGVFLEKAKGVAEIELEDDHLWKVLLDTQLALLYEDFGLVEKAEAFMKNALEMCLRLGQSIDRLGNKREIYRFLNCHSDCYPGVFPEEKKDLDTC